MCAYRSPRTRGRGGGGVRNGETCDVVWITLISPSCPTSSIRLPDVDKELTALQDVLRKYSNAVAAKLTRLREILIRHHRIERSRGQMSFFSLFCARHRINILLARRRDAILLEASRCKMYDEGFAISLSHSERRSI